MTSQRPLPPLNNASDRKLFTVAGPLDPALAGITDAHNHVWIAKVPGADPAAPVLDDQAAIAAELRDYRQAGGGTIVDCQPPGCGRDGNKQLELAIASGVNIVACTGFHLQKYYPTGFWLFQASIKAAQEHFIDELSQALSETRLAEKVVLAGFIKIACTASLAQSPLHLMEAAVGASLECDAAIEVHTEKGLDVEEIVKTLLDFGLPPQRLVLCHMDKRPDFNLHASLGRQGILLEYDTFYRPKYEPEINLWSLLDQMVAAGLESQVAIATDMAEAQLWRRLGGAPGLTGLITTIIPRLVESGFSQATIRKLTGENIAVRLARSA